MNQFMYLTSTKNSKNLWSRRFGTAMENVQEIFEVSLAESFANIEQSTESGDGENDRTSSRKILGT